MKIQPTNPSILSEYFVYDETSPSCLRWIKKASPKSKMLPGDTAGTQRKNGSWQVGVHGSKYLVHRVIWSLFNEDPGQLLIDHKNRDPSDNRISNLRIATRAQNVMNAEYTPKTSKYRGVYQSPDGKFRARLKDQVKWFDNEVEAAKWWNKVAVEQFGEFTLVNQVA